jgi:hypothetical protein
VTGAVPYGISIAPALGWRRARQSSHVKIGFPVTERTSGLWVARRDGTFFPPIGKEVGRRYPEWLSMATWTNSQSGR